MPKPPILLTDEIKPPPALIRAGLDTLPAIIRAKSERASRRFIEFFTDSIRNRNTRARVAARIFILAACRSIKLGTRDVLARVRTIPCDECLQPIRWWNRRIWLVDGERCAHLQCWKGQLFLKALVADEIRRSQLMADEIPRSPRRRSQPSDNGSVDNELQELHASARAPLGRVERLEAQLQQAQESAAKTCVDNNQRNGNLSLTELGQHLSHFLDRSSLFWNFGLDRLVPHHPPCPPRLCMLCGAVAFSGTSVFCTKCGASLSP